VRGTRRIAIGLFKFDFDVMARFQNPFHAVKPSIFSVNND